MSKVEIEQDEYEQLKQEADKARIIREKQRESALKANSLYTHEKRSKAALKAWKTRRKNKKKHDKV